MMNEPRADTYSRSEVYPTGRRELQPAAPSARTPAVPGEGPNMHHGLSDEVIGNPISVEEAYQGSMRGMLGREIGSYIAATFLAGTEHLVRWAGQLYEVGNNYIVIYQEDEQRYVVGDINSLRFVEFSERGTPCGCGRPCTEGHPTSW